MSIKDFFKEGHSVKTIQDLNKEDLGKEVESSDYLDVYNKIQSRYIPPIDYTNPENFVKFGSAESYYTDAIERIYNTYPYDGSLFEKLKWEHSSSFLDLHIFKNEYPRTTGYALFSPGGWGTQAASVGDWGLSSDPEYIQVKGGPNAGDISYAPYTNSNIYDSSKKRESNLALDIDEGVTVEFWLKKAALVSDSLTDYETIFDVWNGDTTSDSYGRLFIQVPVASGELQLYIYSGSVVNTFTGTGVTVSTDDKWHHYAISTRNGSSKTNATFYKDGKFVGTWVGAGAGGTTGEIAGSLIANIGAARLPAFTRANAAALSTAQAIDGYAKLSGSIDEFRFWKNERTSEQVGRYWFDQVGGGTNTDDANTDLGIYYKFNEGIVGTSSYDSVVLDYSGRVSNGSWTGYLPTSRFTGSAIVESSASLREFKDPIIRSNHPKVIYYKDKKVMEGREFDFRNNAAIINTVPSWITEKDAENENFTLKKLTQIIASYFDKLSLQMEALPRLRDSNYASSSYTPSPFSDRVLDSAGMSMQMDLFDLASALEYYKTRSDDKIFEKKIQDVKNLIYQNVYNNLIHIYKSKGTEKAFRNMIRCFGLGEEVYRLNTYSNDETYEFRDNYLSTTETKKYINFNDLDRSDATIYQYKDESNANATSFIEGTQNTDGTKEGSGHSMTVESEIMFPKKVMRDSTVFGNQFNVQTGSLFGMHTALTASSKENILTWASHDYANFQVYSVRTTDVITGDLTKNAYFLLTCSAGGLGGNVPKLKSPKFYNIYDDKRWNFAVRIKPQDNPFQSAVSGSTDDPDDRKYDVEFYGVNNSLDIVDNEFTVSGTMTYDQGIEFLSSPKRLYAGAYRQHFTGSLLHSSDIKLGSLKHWNTYLSNATIKQHSFDPKNYGASNPIKNAFLHQDSLSAKEIPEIKTLALNWDFNLITGSNASGRFLVEDFSSGSAKGRYGWVGDITDKQHTGRADFFNNTSKAVFSTEYINTAKKQLPEVLYSSDTVKIVSQNDEKFTRNTRPSRSTFVIEKSMYRTISEEMLNMFSSITAFNNLIGEPADKYRQKYKKLEKLRQLFFERVKNTPDVEKYVDYYKWVDGALSEMLKKLIPMSADFSDDPTQNIVESHILERNKYHHKFPTLEFKGTDPEAHIKGANELGYDWKHGHAPITDSENDNCLWWKDRADREGVLSSGDSGIDSDKKEILHVYTTTDVSGSSYAIRNFTKPYRFSTDIEKEISSGVNFSKNKKMDFHKNLSNEFVIEITTGSATSTCNDFKDITFKKNKEIKTKIYKFNQMSKHSFNFNGDNVSNLYWDGGDSTNMSWYGASNEDDPMTIAFWVYPQRLAGTWSQYIFHKGAFSGEYNMYITTSGLLTMLLLDTGGSHTRTSDQILLEKDKWQHVVFTYGGDAGGPSSMQWYVDGKKKGGAGADYGAYSGMANTSDVVEFGASTATTNGFKGSLSEFATWQRVLTAAEVKELYESKDLSAHSQYSNVTNWYRFGTQPLDGDPDGNDVYVVDNAKNTGSEMLANGAGGANCKGGFRKGGAFTLEELTKQQYSLKSANLVPFNIVSSSIANNNDFHQTITNLHSDVYGDDKALPLQGFFAEQFVGGKRHRHTDLNLGSDSENSREEGWRLITWGEFGKLLVPSHFAGGQENLYSLFNSPSDIAGVASQRSTGPFQTTTYREEYAKRPVNIKNIQMTTGSVSREGTQLGNYTHPYEVVQTVGRKTNNRWFVENEGIDNVTNVRSYQVSGAYERLLPTRTKNKTVFTERFSAPGGPEINGRGFLDMESEEYSLYNALPWRNLTVRQPLQDLLTKHAGKFGVDNETGDTSKGQFTDAAFHKINKNRSRRFEVSGNVKYDRATGVDGYDGAHTASVYDNWYVQRPIPQSDMQYAWITASAINNPTNAVLGYQQPNYKRGDLASDDIIFVSASDHVAYGTLGLVFFGASRKALEAQATRNIVEAVDFVGMNNNITEPIDSEDNILGNSEMTYVADATFRGTSNYINHDLVDWVLEDVPPGDAFDRGRGAILNGIILHRQGPYGWPSWKQIRTGNHPIVRKHKKENTISFTHPKPAVVLSEQLISYAEPVVTSKYSPMVHKIDMWLDSDHESTESKFVKHTYANNIVKFTKRTPVKDQPTLEEKFGKNTNFNLPSPPTSMYKKINTLVFKENVPPEHNPVKSLQSVFYRENVFPKERYTYSSTVRGRDSYECSFWREKKSDRVLYKQENSQHWRVSEQSMWPLDERRDWATAASTGYGGLSGSSQAGELQNNYTIYHNVSNANAHTHVTAACLLDYPRWEMDPPTGRRDWTNIKFYSDQKWEAPEQAGKEPFTIDYETWADNMRRVAKDFSVVPEFRISDHMPFYVNEKGGNFRATKANGVLEDFLNLSGSTNDVATYSHSDFMKHFGEIKKYYQDKNINDENQQTLKEKRLTLTMEAAMKLLPYDGFYPATRTLQLGRLFQDCYGDKVNFTNGSSEPNMRTALQPLFAPGILYNTIKSGIAVDWPVLDGSTVATTSHSNHRPRYAISASAATALDWYESGENGFKQKRVEFTDLLNPAASLAFMDSIPDCNPHPSASLDSEARLNDSSSPLYTLAMHNFLAETVDFFLKDGDLQSFASSADSDPNKFIAEKGVSKYIMDLLMYRNTTYGTTADLSADALAELWANCRPVNKDYSTFEMCDNWAAFGPPVDATVNVLGYKHCDSRDPYTPPYYNGLARARFTWTPPHTDGGAVTLQQILQNTTIEYRRMLGFATDVDDPIDIHDSTIMSPAGLGLYNYFHQALAVNSREATYPFSTAGAHAMQIDSCMNLKQLAPHLKPTYDAVGNVIALEETGDSVWVIQTKFETPVLNFKNRGNPTVQPLPPTTPAHGTGSVVTGMWHQYGTIPEKDEGIFIEIADPLNYFTFGDKDASGAIVTAADNNKPVENWRGAGNLTGATGSLADLCGFAKGKPQRLGQITPTKKISEAVVAIPYMENAQDKTFFNLSAAVVKNAESLIKDSSLKFYGEDESDPSLHPDDAIIDMVEKMQRFVFPPNIDFLTYDNIHPFAMYIFEFTHDLTQEDLKDIWQNLPPDDTVGGTKTGIGQNFNMQRQTITHELMEYQSLGGGKFLLVPQGHTKVPLVNVFPENTKWIVFKVKQKAAKNYYTKTAETKDDTRFQFNQIFGSENAEKESVPDYSYNWPYDYFSLVELIKLRAEVEIGEVD